jgi:hypothetical protein
MTITSYVLDNSGVIMRFVVNAPWEKIKYYIARPVDISAIKTFTWQGKHITGGIDLVCMETY